MNKEEIREILAAHRPGSDDASDPLIAQAMAEAQQYPELATWFSEEQEFDRQFARALAASPLPAGLKTKLMAAEASGQARSFRRSRSVGWAIAAISVLIVLFSSWRGLLQPATSLADFRGEMVSFVRLTPPLELETSHLERIQTWLAGKGAPAPVLVPPGLEALEPVGCRVLSFRGQKVTLICFRRSGAQLVHLIVVDRARLPQSKAEPVFANEGAWTTAMWSRDRQVYLLTTKGDRSLLQRYLGAANEKPGS